MRYVNVRPIPPAGSGLTGLIPYTAVSQSAVTGSGTADKAQVRAMVERLLGEVGLSGMADRDTGALSADQLITNGCSVGGLLSTKNFDAWSAVFTADPQPVVIPHPSRQARFSGRSSSILTSEEAVISSNMKP